MVLLWFCGISWNAQIRISSNATRLPEQLCPSSVVPLSGQSGFKPLSQTAVRALHCEEYSFYTVLHMKWPAPSLMHIAKPTSRTDPAVSGRIHIPLVACWPCQPRTAETVPVCQLLCGPYRCGGNSSAAPSHSSHRAQPQKKLSLGQSLQQCRAGSCLKKMRVSVASLSFWRCRLWSEVALLLSCLSMETLRGPREWALVPGVKCFRVWEA